MNEIENVLQNYSGNQATNTPEAIGDHFGQAAQAAPAPALADSLAAMFRSDKTPPFGQMIGQLFSNSNGAQRASLLNTLLSSSAGAGLLSQLQSAGISLPVNAATPTVTPETAAQIPPEKVEQAAAHVAQHDPSIIDRVSQIYAEHPTLVKTLGAAAMVIALRHLAQHRG